MKTLFSLLLGWLLLSTGTLLAQPITVTTTTSDLVQCGPPRPFTVTIHNNTASPLPISAIQLQLPGCVRYVSGSIAGTGFSVPYVNALGDSLHVQYSASLAQFATVILTIQVRAVCGNSCGPVATNNIHVVHGQGAYHGSSPPYNILSPSLSLLPVVPQTTSATVGSTFQRCVSFVNAGFGALSEVFLDVQANPASLHNSNFRLGSNGPSLSAIPNGNTQTLQIGPAQIQMVGDLDGVLEQGEVVNICFDMRVDDCLNLGTNIAARWGCDGQACEVRTGTADVTVPVTVPHVSVTSTYTENRCYGGSTPSILKFIVKNTGTGPARDVKIHLWEGISSGFSPDDLSAFDSVQVWLHPSTGGSIPMVPDSLVPENGAPCALPNGTERLTVTIPFLPVGLTDTVVVLRHSCCKLSCAPMSTRGLYYNVRYQNQCKSNSYVITSTNVVADNIGRIRSITHSGDPNLGANWTDYEIEHSEFRLFRRNAGGYAIVEFTVPAGLQVDTTYGTIYFDYPTLTPNWYPEVGSTIQTGTTIRARFNFGVGYNGNLEKVMLKFRMRADCGAGPCAGGAKVLTYKFYEVPDTNCTCEALIACHDVPVQTHCGICPATCADGGMMFLGFDARRKNYGPSDNDSDGLPDPVNLPNPARRIRHLVLRDTLTTKYTGVVATTLANPYWETGYIKTTITEGARLTPLTCKVRIVDQSTGVVHFDTITTFAPPIDTLTAPVRRTFTFSLNPGAPSFQPALPSGFAYSQGDSVEVVVDYVVNDNIGSTIEMEAITNEFKLQRNNGFKASCDTYRGDFTLVGYYFAADGPNVIKADGCDTVTVSESYYLSIGNCCNNYAGGDVFRYEFRYFALPQQHIATLPIGFTLVGASMDHHRTRGLFNRVDYPMAPIPWSTSGNVATMDLGSRFQQHGGAIPKGDEGFYGTVELKLLPSCHVTPQQTLLMPHRMNFEPIPAFTGPGADFAYDDDIDRIIYESPHLEIIPGSPTVPGVSSTITWPVTIANTSNVADAGHVWFALQSPSGQVLPLQVQAGCSTVVSQTAGLYQVGSLAPGASQQYCISATYASCGLDSLRIIAGWDCNAYPANAPAYTCTPTVRTVYVQPQTAEVQATITTSSSTVGICDSLWVEATVASTQIGYLNDIDLVFSLPLSLGLTYAPGSATLLYPTSGIPMPVSGPTIGSNTLTWHINNINPTIAANGLPGTLQLTQNTFKLRFLVRTNCLMVSGDRIRLQVNAHRSCGQALTPLILLSPPINITGANPPYQSNMTTTIADVSSCPMTKRITVTMVNAGPGNTTIGDRIVLNFGNGYAYGGGFTGITNAPIPNTPTVQSGTGGSSMTWNVPGGLAPGATVSFSFLVNVGNDAPCGTDIAVAQALHNQVLYCARTATNCATSAVQTGSSSLNISNIRPDLGFTAFNATLQHITGADRFHYDLTLENLGLPVVSGTNIPIDFYCDRDGSCSFTPGDNLLFTVNHTSGIGSNSTVALTGNLNAPINACPANTQILAMVNSSFCNCGTAKVCTMLILPVEWQSIQGQALPDANEITWTATILPGHDHFVLEKAVGQGWSDISPRIFGTQGSYGAQDAQPARVERYRVRAVDQDGSTSHSAVVEVVRDAADFQAAIFPNPASRTVHLQAPAGSQYRILNALGQEVATGRLDTEAPQPLDIGRYVAGIYQVEFWRGADRERFRLVVEH